MNVYRWLVYCHTHCDLPLDYRYHKFFHQSYVTYLSKNNKGKFDSFGHFCIKIESFASSLKIWLIYTNHDT